MTLVAKNNSVHEILLNLYLQLYSKKKQKKNLLHRINKYLKTSNLFRKSQRPLLSIFEIEGKRINKLGEEEDVDWILDYFCKKIVTLNFQIWKNLIWCWLWRYSWTTNKHLMNIFLFTMKKLKLILEWITHTERRKRRNRQIEPQGVGVNILQKEEDSVLGIIGVVQGRITNFWWENYKIWQL